MGVFFVKKVDLSSTQGALCTVSVFFLFYILLIWGCTRTPPVCGPGMLKSGFISDVQIQTVWPGPDMTSIATLFVVGLHVVW